MSDEVFDVVNEKDEVVGREIRREVHRRHLLHRAVHVLIYNRAGRLFLQKRSLNKDNSPGLWDSSSSGHVDAGESYDDCAIREVREELGFELPGVPDRLFKVDACSETEQEFVWVYRARAEGPFVLHPEEIDSGDWFEPAAVQRWVDSKPQEFASSFRFIWQRLQSGADRGRP